MRQTGSVPHLPDPSSLLHRTPGGGTAEAEARLRDGSRLLIGRVMPQDAPRLSEGFARLSEESRRLRFLTTKPTLSAAEVRYLTEVDGHDHEALGAIDPETGRGVGIARFVRDHEDPTHAEVAVTVADDWQRRGLGRLLLERLTDRARAEGITHFTALVSADNRAMQRLVRRIGRPARTAQVADGTFEYDIELGSRGLAHQLEEALRAAAAGQFRLPPRMWEALRALVPIHFGR
ncbi:MAG: GNAT family N-acetyltransferase [Solirubrobacteraceae bacterium]